MRTLRLQSPPQAQDFGAMDAVQLADVCRAWLQCNPDVVLLLGADERVAHVSRGSDPSVEAALSGAAWRSIWPKGERAKAIDAANQARKGETARFQAAFEIEGRRRWWDVIVAAVANRAEDGQPGLLALLRDVTAFKAAGERQAQSRRLEALGRLASGVAHDFNNLLTVIMSATESLATGMGGEDERRLGQVGLEAAERGADLVRRLLIFSRQQPGGRNAADGGGAVFAVAQLVRRTLPETISFQTAVPDALLWCKGDRNELEAALLNLCINGRDAIGARGGRLALRLQAAQLDAGSADALGLKPGRYAEFSVEDDGAGMSEATLERALEPFFTTKAALGGTGLGLSSAHSFARVCGGALVLASREGRGTRVRLYLPLARRPAQGELDLLQPARELADCDVLLVEDDAGVRAQALRLLSDAGCRVMAARDAETALGLLACGRTVDLLLTDLDLPGGMGGRGLAEAARALRPDLKVLFTSGALEALAADQPPDFLAKPYAGAQLLTAVSAALHRYAPSAPRAQRHAAKGAVQ